MFRLDSTPLEIELMILPDTNLILVAAVIEPLRAVNRLLGRKLYGWTISTPDGAPAPTTSGVPIPAARAFDADASPDPLFVLASYREAEQAGRDLLRRIGAAARARSHVVGVESGTWLMARAGLLAGRPAAVHWEDHEAFTTAFPDIDVRSDRFVIDGRRITAGGASPALDLMLELIAARQGPGTAIEVSRQFIYDRPRSPDGPQHAAAFGRLGLRDARVAAAVSIMQQTVEEPLSIAEIARRTGVTARHLQSLFRQVLGIRPQVYYHALRLNLGRRLLLETLLPALEIAGRCGFNSPSAFARAYRVHFGESPSQTRRSRRAGIATAP
jgi:transcriptional regulator GlxA family with amidase domain